MARVMSSDKERRSGAAMVWALEIRQTPNRPMARMARDIMSRKYRESEQVIHAGELGVSAGNDAFNEVLLGSVAGDERADAE